jgi:hypothetical protein
MKNILNNPYRILGILVGATEREKNRQIINLKRFLEAGQTPPVDYSFPALGQLIRTPNAIDTVASKLNRDSDKINAALFWFWKGYDITDEPALDALKNGDMNTALNIWYKLIIETKEDGKKFWKGVTAKNASAFHNYFVIVFGTKNNKNNADKYDAIVGQIRFLESDFYSNFVSQVTDSTFATTKKELQLNFLNAILDEIENGNIKFSLKNLIGLSDKLEFSAKQDFQKSVSRKISARITREIEIVRNKCDSDKAIAIVTGENLYEHTKKDLAQLKEILGTNDFSYSNVADKLANEILQCAIDYFKYSQNNDDDDALKDFSTIAMNLLKKAKSLAIGDIVKQRCEENITELQEWINNKPEREKEKKISFFLNNIMRCLQYYDSKTHTIFNAQALINESKPYLIAVKTVLGKSDKVYLRLSTQIASMAQYKIIEDVNITQERLQIDLQIDRFYSIQQLHATVENAWNATCLLGTLDMDNDFRNNRYDPNRESLKDLCRQLGLSTYVHTFIDPNAAKTPEQIEREKIENQIESKQRQLKAIQDKVFFESELNDVNQAIDNLKKKTFFKNELDNANFELDKEEKKYNDLLQIEYIKMNELKRFHFFRANDTKRQQILEQKSVINYLLSQKKQAINLLNVKIKEIQKKDELEKNKKIKEQQQIIADIIKKANIERQKNIDTMQNEIKQLIKQLKK